MHFYKVPCALLIGVVLFEAIPRTLAQNINFNQSNGGVKAIECTESNGVGTGLTAINGSPIANLATTLASAVTTICGGISAYVACLITDLPSSTNKYDKMVNNTFNLTSLGTLATELCTIATNASDTRTSAIINCLVTDSATTNAIGGCVTTLETAINQDADADSKQITCGTVKSFIDCSTNAVKVQTGCTDPVVYEFLSTSLHNQVQSSCTFTSGTNSLTPFASSTCLCVAFTFIFFKKLFGCS